MKKRITDVISKEEARTWTAGSNVLISAPMGAGKSYFCKNALYDLAKEVDGKILMLIHRSNCVEQFKYEIEADGKADVIDVITYQSLEYGKLHNTSKQIDLSKYKYVVSDEFHYFFNDSSFNNKTAVSFQMIMNSDSYDECMRKLSGRKINEYTMRALIGKAFDNPKIKDSLFVTLYDSNPELFLKMFKNEQNCHTELGKTPRK